MALTRKTLAIGLMAVALAACGRTTDPTIVTSVESDYRKTHPILVGESERRLHLMVGGDDSQLSFPDQRRVEHFAETFLASGAHVLTVHKPRGAHNQKGINRVLPQLLRQLKKSGVRGHHVKVVGYDLRHEQEAAALHLTYRSLTASVHQCGNWEEDLTDTFQNKNYQNFGCASQANFAAQLADPKDLVTPRAPSPVDAEQRAAVLEAYKEVE
ncbi:MAG: CpaD family pilus assembly protein [Pseudomonadota bacterium]